MKNKYLILWLLIASITTIKLISFLNDGFKINTNILQLLPATEKDEFAQNAYKKFSDKNLGNFIFLFESNNLQSAINSAKKLKDILKKDSNIKMSILPSDKSFKTEFSNYFFKFRYHLLSQNDFIHLKNGSVSFFHDRVIQQLYSSISARIANIFVEDPFLFSISSIKSKLIPSNNSWKIVQGFLSKQHNNKYYVLLNGNVTGSPFDTEIQTSLQQDISNFSNFQNKKNSQVTLYKAGTVFYAHEASILAKKEISIVGLGSSLFIIALILLIFSSFKPILLAFIALVFGMIFGITIVYYAFGEVHLLTLIFGSTLIGVSIDYVFHFIIETISSNNKTKIITALSFGLVSSIIGYLSLAIQPFPGLRQISLFCIAGLTGSYLTVVLLFPSLQFNFSLSKGSIRLAETLLSLRKYISIHFLIILSILTFSGLIFALSYLNDNESIRQLQATSKLLKSEENKIYQVLGNVATNQFYIVKGSNENELLNNLNILSSFLDEQIKAHKLSGYNSLSKWVPSKNIQLQSYQLIRKYLMSSELNKFYSEGLLSQRQINQIRFKFNRDNTNFVTISKWLSSSISKPYSNLWLGKINNKSVAIVTLTDLNQNSFLPDINQDIYFVDKVASVSNLFHQYLVSATKMLFIAFLFIYLTLIIRHKFITSIYMLFPPAISICLTLIFLTLIGEPINLFNVMALFLILGIGIDSTIFFAESFNSNIQTTLAILISNFTTLISFGLLSISSTPAIHSFGITILFGIFITFILSLSVSKFITPDNFNSSVKS